MARSRIRVAACRAGTALAQAGLVRGDPGGGRGVVVATAARRPGRQCRRLGRAGRARRARSAWRRARRRRRLAAQPQQAGGLAQRTSIRERRRHRLHRPRQPWRDHHAGPQRQRLFRGDLRRVVRRQRTDHLDRRRRRAQRRSAPGARRGVPGVDVVRRSLRARLLRRQGAAPADDGAGDAGGAADPHPQHPAPRRARHPDHRAVVACGIAGEGAQPGRRHGPARTHGRRPDRRARHRRAHVRGAAYRVRVGDDDFAGLLRAFDLLRAARRPGRARTHGGTGGVPRRDRRRPGGRRAPHAGHRGARRGRRRHGRHDRGVGAAVRGPRAGAREHPRDRAGCERTQHLGRGLRRGCDPRLARGACGVLVVAADAVGGRDRSRQCRPRLAGATGDGGAALQRHRQHPGRSQRPGPAPARDRQQPPHAPGATPARSRRRRQCAGRGRTAGLHALRRATCAPSTCRTR